VYTDDLIRPWFDAVLGAIPGVRLFDVHTHTGASDPDGFRGSLDGLLAALDTAGGADAAFFTMHEPDGYRVANDRVLAEAAASGGRLVPFCRVDPRDGGLAEAERALAAGARGIKLHPRAERFRLADDEVWPLFALAHERRLPVLVHAGRGIPALGRDALELCSAFPDARLILAHAAICDLSWIWRDAADHPNLFFDTAWWTPDDLLALFSLVPPGQVLLGSDAPYGTPLSAAVQHLRYALQAGLSLDQVRAVAGEQARRLVAGEDPLDMGPAPGHASLPTDVLLGRVSTFLVTAAARMLRRGDPEEPIALARMGCEVPDDAPHAGVFRSVLSLLERWTPAARPDEEGLPFSPGAHVVITALAIARTPDVPVPDQAQRSS
jgi:predicted TIM-barrel fold metal-dependent hydrolase